MKALYIFEKRELKLKESDNTAYVDPPGDGNATMASVGSEVSKTLADNPSADSVLINSNNFDGNPIDNTPTISVDASSGNVQKAVQNVANNPSVKKMGDYNVKVNLKKESKKSMPLVENGIKFTKRELNEFLSNI